MTPDEYKTLFERQGGVCAICKRPPQFRDTQLLCHRREDHETVRGLLCGTCYELTRYLELNGEESHRRVLNYLQRTSSDRSWDTYFTRIAELAATRSKDPSNQVGAVLVRGKTIVSTGYNGFPRGVNDRVEERFDRPLKYQWTVHAEENCLLSAARHGANTDGTTLYVTPLFPCARCATSIVQAGVIEVVSSDELKDNPRWAAEFIQSTQILEEGGVILRPPQRPRDV